MADLCPPCVATLRELCAIGHDSRLCSAYEGYLESGDVRYVEEASAIAPPALLQLAKAHLIARGRLPADA